MKRYIMAFDQGTTSSRCILFDRNGNICSMAQREFRQIFPRSGWIEHDPMEIWETQCSVAREAMKKLNVEADDIIAIGIANQRETTVVWDRATGEPVFNAIVWQCRRTADRIEQLKQDGMGDYVRQTTGLVPDAYFSGSKIDWILTHVPDARERARRGELLFGTIETWLIWKLTQGRSHVTDYTNASRTMLFDIHRLQWDEKLLNYFDIPRCMLPEVRPSSAVLGMTSAFGGEILIAGAAGDQQAALFGQCCFDPGEVKNTYGTGCFMLMNTGSKPVSSRHGMITTIAASADGVDVSYALEGSIFIAGAAVQWLRDEMGLISKSSDSEICCRRVADSGGVYMVPAFTGMGAPYWNQFVRGAVVGLTRGVTRDHFVRATVESMAYQVRDLLVAMHRDSGIEISVLKVDGGASGNDFLMQFQADLLDAKIVRPGCIETTALGAAYLAGLAVGFWDGMDEIRSQWSVEARFESRIDGQQRHKLISGWERAVRCALNWAEQ